MKKKKHARWRWYEILLVGALLGLAVCSTAWLTSYWGQMRAAQQTFEKLAQAVRAAARCFLPRLRPLLLLLSMISPLLIFKFRGYFTPVG